VLTSAKFPAMGTTTVVVVDEATALPAALAIAREVIGAVDRTCSRFQSDSELSLVNRGAGTGARRVSPLLDRALGAALDAARSTGGLVDPTVGRLMERIGYTVTFGDLPPFGAAIELEVRRAPGWRQVTHAGGSVELPGDVSLDLGAIGKAGAPDPAAAAAAARIGVGVMVGCGGDVAVAGPAPAGGWRVRVSEGDHDPAWQDVMLHDGGLATSGTQARTWRRGNRTLHHILDPSTGRPACTRWRTASVAAATCAEANAAATSSIILGDAAADWLAAQGLPGRLVGDDGTLVRVGDWPG
jgi:thiamine biosynthesis lipoprotein